LKRSLHVIGQGSNDDLGEPEVVKVGHRQVTIQAIGSAPSSGSSAARFATFMLDAGAERATPANGRDSVSIVIRDGAPAASDHDLEAEADYVLGSARPAFARWLVEALSA
jgi:hypothetical protein